MQTYDIDFHPEKRSAVVRRRLVTIPRNLAMLVGLTILLPVLAMAALILDVSRAIIWRRPFLAVRLVIFAWVFLAVEAWVLARLLGGWITAGFGRNRKRLIESTWPMQSWWARTLFGAVQRIFAMKLEVEGLTDAKPGPVIVMFRHASIVDNLLPLVLLHDRLGMKMRWIIKKELLAIPELDVAGNRLPNYFVDRESSNPRKELRQISQLATGLGVDEGVLIYPEGTRFTAERRRRSLERLALSNPELAKRAERLRHVLPPRVGGTLGLLKSGHDVVVGAHRGLGGFAKISDMWSGDIIGTTIRVQLRRVAATDIPTSRGQRVEWLYDQWQWIDDWIEQAAD